MRGTLQNGTFRFVAARLTEAAREAARKHGLHDHAAAVLGEALVATAIMSTPLKTEDEKYSLSVNGQGALRSLHADIDYEGDLRAYLVLADQPDVLERTADELMAPPGFVRVSRSTPGDVKYQAVTEMRLGSIGLDLAFHASMSDQIETELQVYIAGSGDQRVVGGLLIQAMPGASIEDFVPIREALHNRKVPRPTAELIERPERLVQQLLGPFAPQLLEISQVQLRCTCSRERVQEIFDQLDPAQLADLTVPDGSAFADCQWCGTSYHFSADEMNALLLRIDDDALSH